LLELFDRIGRHLGPWCRILAGERDGVLEAFVLAYGPLTYPAKVIRGCRLDPRTTYLRVPAAVRPAVAAAAAAVSELNRTGFRHLVDRHPPGRAG